MQAGEDDLDHRHTFFGMQTEGDAAAIVGDRDRAIAMLDQIDLFAETGQGLIGSVVDDFLDRMQRVAGAGVHARALLDRLQALEHPDRAFSVTACR